MRQRNDGERGDDDYERGYWANDFDRGDVDASRARSFEPDYHQWRNEQLKRLDDDYEAFRHERHSRFAEEFNTWRSHRAQHKP